MYAPLPMRPTWNRLIRTFAAILIAAPILTGPVRGDDGGLETVSYRIRYRRPAEVAIVFRPLVEREPGVRFRVDEDRGRVILRGPAWTHDLLETVLARMDVASNPAADAGAGADRSAVATSGRSASDQRDGAGVPSPRVELSPPSSQPPSSPPPSSPQSASPPSPSRPSPSEPSITRRLYSLPRGRAGHIRRELAELLRAKMGPTGGDDTGWEVQASSGRLKLDFDLAREDLLADGPGDAVRQFSQMLTAISRGDSGFPGDAGGRDRHERVLSVTPEAQPHVAALLRAAAEATGGRHPGGRDAAGIHRGQNGPFRLTASPLQVGDDAPAAEPATDEPAEGPPGAAALPQLEGIEIEALPELDAIILRGRDRDVEELAEIIRQLETLSRETRPAIEIIRLRFAQSGRIAEIIDETQESLVGNRQGRAQVVPLGKPNAMLLIGWGEAVSALKELIGKLDQPVEAETQFDVFRLKYATAATVQQAIEGFFAGRPEGMGPSIQSTVDGRTNSLVVHAAPRDMTEVARLIERLDSADSRSVQRTRVFPIRNSIAADVAATLQEAIQSPTGDARGTTMELLIDDPTRQELVVSGILENIQVTVDARKNNLIISAPAENFELIEALIRQLDAEGMVAQIKIFPIINGDATSLVETLRALLPSQAADGTAGPLTQLSSAPGETSLAPLRFTVDARSNSIIASGSEGDLRIVDALIVRLDEGDTMQRKNMVYQLKNSPAVDVALAINEFLRSTRQVEIATPGAANPFQRLEREVVVVPEPVANKLVLSATPRYFTEIEALIEKLDEQPPQVMIQALIAEVTLGTAEEFGVELGLQDSVLFDRGLLGDLVTLTQTQQSSTPAGIVTETQELIIGAENTPGFNFNNNPLGNSGSDRALARSGAVGGQGLSNFAVGRTNAELGFGGLVLSASSQNVNVLLRALEESRRMQVLSRPQVLTLDNQPAFIQVGQRVPRIIGSSINQIGQQNAVALENVGLILGVTPRISPEGNVVMEIDAEKSDVGPESEGIPVSVSAEGTAVRSPRINVASAQATVSAADGETIILGGLITKSNQEIHRKVPYLGDLPLLRHLFRFDSVIERRTELLIILTPHVIRSAADMERLKQVETARMSWCAADVFDLHGEVLDNPEMSQLIAEEGPWEVIYPHVDPRGSGGPRKWDGATEPQPLDPPDGVVDPNRGTFDDEFPGFPESLPPLGEQSARPTGDPLIGRGLADSPDAGDRPEGIRRLNPPGRPVSGEAAPNRPAVSYRESQR